MITLDEQSIKHKIQLFRLLRAILSSNLLANELAFKGGTYASLLGYLDRFSIDLDFDLPNKEISSSLKKHLYKIFEELGLVIKDESKNYLQFFLKYSSEGTNDRNTLKLEINDVPSKFNKYEKVNLPEINMYCTGHTPPTMFANKLVAAKARYDKNGKIAGRDFYDIYKFFEHGIGINKEIIQDLTHLPYKEYLQALHKFIESLVTERSLREDLNPLVKPEYLNKIIEHLKPELLVYLENEINKA